MKFRSREIVSMALISKSRVARSIVALVAVFVIGTAGYMIIEGWSLLNASYMTIITFTTVGYAEVQPLSTVGRVFTMFLMIVGVGVMLYVLMAVMKAIIEEEIFRSFFRRRRMKTRLAGERNHFILCGFGRVGKEVAFAFQQESVRCTVIDPDSHSISEADNLGFAYIQGDATDDDVLKLAGIQRARGLVAATGNDSSNVFITLSARGLNPDLLIVARTSIFENEGKLRRAGADKVVSPHAIGGRRMAMSAVRPLAVDFVDTMFDSSRGKNLRLTEIQVTDGSPLVGCKVSEYERRSGIEVLAMKRNNGDMIVRIGGDVFVELGDSLFVVDSGAQLESREGKE